MRIFVFEDSDSRNTWFREKFKDQEAYYSMEIEEAKPILKSGKWDAVFFDHDMVMQYTDSDETRNNGYKLAMWCVKNEIPISKCFVHSENPGGARRISKALTEWYDYVVICPFSALVNQLEIS